MFQAIADLVQKPGVVAIVVAVIGAFGAVAVAFINSKGEWAVSKRRRRKTRLKHRLQSGMPACGAFIRWRERCAGTTLVEATRYVDVRVPIMRCSRRSHWRPEDRCGMAGMFRRRTDEPTSSPISCREEGEASL